MKDRLEIFPIIFGALKRSRLGIMLAMIFFFGVSLHAQTTSELGSAATQQVVQKVEAEIDYLAANATSQVDEYLQEAYGNLITEFLEGDDLLHEFAVVVEGSDHLTKKLSEECCDELAIERKSQLENGGESISKLFEGIVITSNNLSGVDEAISIIRNLKNQ
jgi:hypothetical protein